MISNSIQFQLPYVIAVPQANSISTGFLSALAQKIVNHPEIYTDEFVKNTNIKTGVYWRTIISECSTLHQPINLGMVEDILKFLMLSMMSYNKNTGTRLLDNFRSKFHQQVTKPAMRKTWKDMDHHLMPNIKCGRISFSKYTKPWQVKLKIVLVYAVAYQFDLYLESLNN